MHGSSSEGNGNGEIDGRLDEVQRLYEEGDIDGAWNALQLTIEVHPEDPDLRHWEALLLAEDGRLDEALENLDWILEGDPGRIDAALDRIEVLMDLGSFDAALSDLETLEQEYGPELDELERGTLAFDKASCLDRLGHTEEADYEFGKAEDLVPDEFQRPARLAPAEFGEVVESALDSIPAEFDEYVRDLVVEIEAYPSERVSSEYGPFILGLYEGVPRTARDHELSGHVDRIFLYQRNLEIAFPERAELIEEIRKTVIHEVAHHFGLEEDDMGDYA